MVVGIRRQVVSARAVDRSGRHGTGRPAGVATNSDAGLLGTGARVRSRIAIPGLRQRRPWPVPLVRIRATPGVRRGGPPKTNGLAIASLICSCAGLFFLPAILGIVLGFVARAQIKRSNGAQRATGSPSPASSSGSAGWCCSSSGIALGRQATPPTAASSLPCSPVPVAAPSAPKGRSNTCKVCSTASDREPWTPPDESNHLMAGLSRTPMRLQELDRPTPIRDDWASPRRGLTGICGSDAKMVFMDFGDDFGDGALNGYFSFPTVFGHEVVADVVEVGPAVTTLERRAAGRPEPVAVVRASGHRPAVPVMPGRRLQPLLALHAGPDRTGHPHGHLEGRARRLRRLPPGPRVDAHPRA